MLSGLLLVAAAVTVNFDNETGKIRPELHSSGFGPQICSCPKEYIEDVKSMRFKAARTHDWALINPNQRVCDYFHIFPLMHLDAKDPENYVFGPTDYLLKRTREETGLDIFYRLGTSIEHSGKTHFNALIPEDFDKVAEIFAGTVRHYNEGWADGHRWGIKYWEIWNEPDIRGAMWCLPDGDYGKGATPEAIKADQIARNIKRRDLFFKFYVKCLKRLKTEFPDIKVGGPAIAGWSAGYFKMLFNACKAAGVAPDFISWHHYTDDPGVMMRAIAEARQICDRYGFKDCELVINEWHYFGKYSWGDLRSPLPEKYKIAWEGPGSHNGIDSSCFNITMLSKFQTSELDQGFYYGCKNTGAWGYMDHFKRKYKVYHGLRMFGELIDGHPVICESKGTETVTVLAVKTADGARKGFIVADYRGRGKEIAVDVKGVPSGAPVKVWRHDHLSDKLKVPARFADGKLVLEKADENSAAFLVLF